jgi:hypothetical protein
VSRRRGPLLADPSAGRMAAEVEDAVEAWRTMESHPSVAAVLGSRVLPRSERQYPGAVLERELSSECPGHDQAKAVVGSR